ncbi:hypothetical protein ACFVHB_04805 [Kitasatospora sp. NPDC127111]|uniref:hypothetical protein n=1 Tax=Kitasatospora sp. NPDC127111 TaxID=3345363 RepID=UPI00363A12B4
MSSSDNITRLAKRIRRSTEIPWATALRLARSGDAFVKAPVPDTVDADQLRLEAMVTHTLANAFQDRQLNGALLGVVHADTEGDELLLRLEPGMATEALGELLPRWDAHYRGLRGVPGLRPRADGDQVVLSSLLGGARITLATADRSPFRTPRVLDGETPLWDRSPAVLVDPELAGARRWDSPPERDRSARDLLLSRVLRRPALVNRAAAPHGIANCYTHGTTDLVISWCCGPALEELLATLLAHGTAEGLPKAAAARYLPASDTALLGGQALVLRRHRSCTVPTHSISPEALDALTREDYAR